MLYEDERGGQSMFIEFGGCNSMKKVTYIPNFVNKKNASITN